MTGQKVGKVGNVFLLLHRKPKINLSKWSPNLLFTLQMLRHYTGILKYGHCPDIMRIFLILEKVASLILECNQSLYPVFMKGGAVELSKLEPM